MTYALSYKPRFLRSVRRLCGKREQMRRRVEKTLLQISQHPMHPGLHTHKVCHASGESVLSSRVTGDLRIIWEWSKDEIHTIDILDIGGHEGSRSVYR